MNGRYLKRKQNKDAMFYFNVGWLKVTEGLFYYSPQVAACDSLQVGRPRVLKRRLRLKLVFRVWNWSKFGVLETKRRTSPNRAFALQLRTATTASHPVVITARKIEARSWWDSWGCRIRQAAVLGRQNRLTRCFRELAKWIHTSFRSREPINSAMATYRWNMAFTKHFVVFRRIV